MSHSIIFETKIVKTSDGRIIHFDRRGCNNDTAGRSKDEFTAQLYTEDSFLKIINDFKGRAKPYSESEPHDWDLKIGSRCATFYDYGEHLYRMYSRALKYEEFLKSYLFMCVQCTGVEVLSPIHQIMSCKEFDENFYELLNKGGTLRYTHLKRFPDVSNESEILSLIEEKKDISFEIRKRKK